MALAPKIFHLLSENGDIFESTSSCFEAKVFFIPFLQFINTMTIDIHTYTVEELAIWLKNRPTGASFVDVREHDELVEQGTIHGYNLNIPYFLTNTNVALFEKKFSVLDKENQVII